MQLPGVELRVWLGDNISEAPPHTPTPQPGPQASSDGAGWWVIKKSTFQNTPSRSLPVGNQNWMAKNGREMGGRKWGVARQGRGPLGLLPHSSAPSGPGFQHEGVKYSSSVSPPHAQQN